MASRRRNAAGEDDSESDCFTDDDTGVEDDLEESEINSENCDDPSLQEKEEDSNVKSRGEYILEQENNMKGEEKDDATVDEPSKTAIEVSQLQGDKTLILIPFGSNGTKQDGLDVLEWTNLSVEEMENHRASGDTEKSNVDEEKKLHNPKNVGERVSLPLTSRQDKAKIIRVVEEVEKKNDPAAVPKGGNFFLHDNREGSNNSKQNPASSLSRKNRYLYYILIMVLAGYDC